MIRDTAVQLASEAAARVWKLIGDLRYAKQPLIRFQAEIDDAKEVLFTVLNMFHEEELSGENADLYRPLSKAYYQLVHAEKKNHVKKKHVVLACDFLGPLLPRRR